MGYCWQVFTLSFMLVNVVTIVCLGKVTFVCYVMSSEAYCFFRSTVPQHACSIVLGLYSSDAFNWDSIGVLWCLPKLEIFWQFCSQAHKLHFSVSLLKYLIKTLYKNFFQHYMMDLIFQYCMHIWWNDGFTRRYH